MHLQAWDPYYFSPFGVETKLKELFNGWGPDFFSPLLASFFIFLFELYFSLLLCKFVSLSKL